MFGKMKPAGPAVFVSYLPLFVFGVAKNLHIAAIF